MIQSGKKPIQPAPDSRADDSADHNDRGDNDVRERQGIDDLLRMGQNTHTYHQHPQQLFGEEVRKTFRPGFNLR